MFLICKSNNQFDFVFWFCCHFDLYNLHQFTLQTYWWWILCIRYNYLSIVKLQKSVLFLAVFKSHIFSNICFKIKNQIPCVVWIALWCVPAWSSSVSGPLGERISWAPNTPENGGHWCIRYVVVWVSICIQTIKVSMYAFQCVSAVQWM